MSLQMSGWCLEMKLEEAEKLSVGGSLVDVLRLVSFSLSSNFASKHQPGVGSDI